MTLLPNHFDARTTALWCRCGRLHPREYPCFDRRAARVELLRLVKIGELRNGREIFMPAPEVELLWHEAYDAAIEGFTGDVMFAWWSAQHFCRELRALFVADQQRVHDAIMTGEPRPFEARDLPTFAQIYRQG